MKRTFHIDDSNKNAQAFIDFMKTLEFVQFDDDSLSFELSDAQKNELDKRRTEYLSGNSETTTWEKIKEKARASK